MRRLAALSTAALLALGAVPALALEAQEPVFVEQAVWFHDGGRKVGNLAAVDPALNPRTFDTRKPTASVTSGAGGGHLADAGSEIALGEYGDASGPAFTGTFTGDLDTIDVDLFAFTARSNQVLSVRSQLVVDGRVLFADAQATNVQTVAGGQAARLGKFRYAGLHAAMQEAGIPVGPDVKHTVTLRALVFFVGTETVFLYDSSEVPSGMVFNDDAPLAGRTVFDLTPPPLED